MVKERWPPSKMFLLSLEVPDRYVLLGNHRDAWTYGAVDPNSGTAAVVDIARRYATLLNMGWRPRRTVVLCSWDAEEFGMIGSIFFPFQIGFTEWVEQNLILLGSKAVAYLNMDCAVQGPGLFAGACPQLDDILVEVMKRSRILMWTAQWFMNNGQLLMKALTFGGLVEWTLILLHFCIMLVFLLLICTTEKIFRCIIQLLTLMNG